jgi:glyoxylate reductase
MKVLVSGRLPKAVISCLEERHEVECHGEDRPMERQRLLRSVRDRDGLLCMITDRIDEELLGRAPGLKMIANCAVGFDNIDLDAAAARGIPVSNTPDVLTDATADLAFALVLATARRVVEGDRMTRAGEFRFWAPLHFLGTEVTGKTLGIVGMGRIGRAVARRAGGFDMRVIYNKRERLSPPQEDTLGVTYIELERLIEEADFISLHVPLTPETRHLFGAKELAAMKPSAFLINTSRGPVVDEAALVEAVREGRIAGAGLDVYENEPSLTSGLTELANVVLLPHVGSATVETRTAMAFRAAENLLAGLDGQRPPHCLNWEDLRQAP